MVHASTKVQPNAPKTTSDTLPDNPDKKYPSGVGQNDLNKTVTRTINITAPGASTPTSTTQTVKLVRTATVDEVTDNVKYGDWKVASDSPAADWKAQSVTNYDGYTTNITSTVDGTTSNISSIDEVTVNGDTKDTTINVTYTANNQQVKFQFIDNDNNNTEVGSDITKSGVTDQKLTNLGLTVPAGYKLAANQALPTDYTFTAGSDQVVKINLVHEKATVQPNAPKTTRDPLPDNPSKNYPSGVAKADLNKTLKRTIKITKPDGTVVDKSQNLSFTRQATVDEVTGLVTYSDWSPVTDGAFSEVDAPTVTGYTPSKAKVDATNTLTQDQIKNWTDPDDEIDYTANPQTVKFQFIDNDDNNAEIGSDITKSGVTDQKLTNLGLTVPAGYKLAADQTLPTSYTFTADKNQVVKINLVHGKVTVQPNDPKKTSDTLPDDPSKNYPSGVDQNDLNKTLKRTITVTEPGSTAADESQTLSFTRTATVDEVTGTVTYSNWTPVDGGSFAEYDAPDVSGYTPSQAKVKATTALTQDQIKNWTDTPTNITYTPNDQSGKISYVDDKGNEVGSTALSGKTDQNITITPVIPAGWKESKGQTIPATEKATATGIPTVTIKIEHATIKVNPDDPSGPTIPTGTAPGDSTKTYQHVSKDDLTKTVIRTINVTAPGASAPTTTTQSVKLVRTATFDEVTGKATYGDWTVSTSSPAKNWAAQSVASHDGYTTKITSTVGGTISDINSIDEVTVDGTTKDTTIDVTYTANDQSGKISYVDKDGNEVGSTALSGKTDQDVTITPVIPAGWKETAGQTIPATEKATATGIPTVTIKIEHATVTVQPNDPKKTSDKLPDNPSKNYPSGVDQNDLNKTLTRTIKFEEPDGTVVDKTQTLKFTQTATVDEVTGDVTYGKWTPVDGDSFKKVDAPTVPGYTPKQASVDATGTLTQDQINHWTDPNKNIKYTPNDQSGKISYVDADGTEVGSTVLSGKTDQDVTISPVIPAGWKEVADQTIPATEKATATGIPTVTVKVEHATIVVNPDDPSSPAIPTGTVPGDSTKTYQNVTNDDLTKTLTRTINVTAPDASSPTTTHQTVKLVRTATFDEVTGKAAYGDWAVSTSSPVKNWAAKSVDSHDGYTTKITSTVDGTTSTINSIDKVTVNGNTKDTTIDVTYKANDQSGKISYVDKDGNEVGSTALSGKTDQDVTISPVAPAGWKIVSGQNIPATEKATATGIPTVTVKVEHATVTVQPNDPKAPADKLPDNPDKNYPSGVAKENLNKTLTRTIKITKPDGTVVDKSQNLSFTRTATVDEVTGDVTYSDWTPASDADFAEVDAPTVAGYTPSQTKVDASGTLSQDKIKNWTDPNIKITYTANDQSGKISYVDDKGNEVGSTALSGKTDQDVTISPVAPAGWKIVSGQNIPATEKATATGIPTVTVKVEHATVTVQPTSPKSLADKLPDNPGKNYPSGVAKYDLNKTLRRTIKFEEPDGTVVDKTQTLKFTRTATVDEVTGDVTYSDWTPVDGDSFVQVDAPTVPGYTPTQANVPATKTLTQDQINNWTDPNNDIKYTANDQSGKISYVDAKGNEVGSTALSGKTDQDVTISPVAPAGWKIVSEQNIPATEKATATGIQTVKVKVEHATVTVHPTAPKTSVDKLPDNQGKYYPSGVAKDDLNKTLTRTIKFEEPNGTVVDKIQTLKFTRTATVDEVTGDVAYSDWTPSSDAGFKKVDAPTVPGYTPSQTSVDATGALTQDQINHWTDPKKGIKYKANDQSGKISYVDANGKEISSTPLTGKTDETITITPQLPTGWKQVADQNVPKTVKATATGIPTVTIKIEHATTTVTNPTDPSKSLPDNPNKNYPAISHDDLNKTLTRTIKITRPDGTVINRTQTLRFQRTATIDEVSGAMTYGPWTATGETGFDQVNVPQLPGYVASQKVIAGTGDLSQAAIDRWENPNVLITYQSVGHQSNTTFASVHQNNNLSRNAGSEPAIGVQHHPGNNQQHSNHGPQLPQTGNQVTDSLLGVGLMAIAGALGLLGFKKKQG